MVDHKTIKVSVSVYEHLKVFRLKEQGRLEKGLTISEAIDLLVTMEVDLRKVVSKQNHKQINLPVVGLVEKVVDGCLGKTK